MRISPSSLLKNIFLAFITYMPGALGIKMRYRYYRNKFKRCGKNAVICQGVLIQNPENVSVGNNVCIDKYCIIETGRPKIEKKRRNTAIAHQNIEGELILGDDIHIAEFCMVIANGGISIGNNCGLSAGTKLYSISSMAYDPDDRKRVVCAVPYDQAVIIAAPIVLEDNVWIGLNGIVMPGTHIGKNSFVVSNALVKGIFPENSYIAGQPAKRIRDRFFTDNHPEGE